MSSATRWGARAVQVYDDAYARRYRDHDEASVEGASITHLSSWIASVCETFGRPIDVLDLGCGTGRYFHALVHVRRLVGIDVSKPMLGLARQPVGQCVGAETIDLVEADFLRHDFGPGAFDLVYSVGVLAEHTPLDAAVATRVARWLRSGGRFAFTAVHPSCASVPRTLKRRMAEGVLPIVGGAVHRALHARLLGGGLYADEPWLRGVLSSAGFAVESVEPFQSDVHLHLLTVARKTG